MEKRATSDPLHALSLQAILEKLIERYGWEDLGTRIKIRCFTHDPNIKSSLVFLRRTPWAREKLEKLYVYSFRKRAVKPEKIEKNMTYCEYAASIPEGEENVHKLYHDTQYGFPLDDDNELFGRLILEINQAGLSWTTILRKQENFRAVYDGFSIGKIAAYGDADRERLLGDARIIRNRLKIEAAIKNAQRILELRHEYGSFKAWLDARAKECPDLDAWTRLFKKTFTFTGGEIVKEFLMSTGYLPGAHVSTCPVYAKLRSKA